MKLNSLDIYMDCYAKINKIAIAVHDLVFFNEGKRVSPHLELEGIGYPRFPTTLIFSPATAESILSYGFFNTLNNRSVRLNANSLKIDKPTIKWK